jgi:hypothetical protein
LCLSDLGFEVHDDVLCESVLFANSEHGKELIEVCFREFGVYSEPELCPLFKRRDDPAFRSDCSFLRSGHVATFL